MTTTIVDSKTAAVDLLTQRARLSALWLFVLMNLIFRDLHEIVKADFLADALNGIYNGQEITEVMFLLGGVIVEVPIMMIVLSWFLPVRANRLAQAISAIFFGIFVVASLPGDLDDTFHGVLEFLALAAILWRAWSWEQQSPTELSPAPA